MGIFEQILGGIVGAIFGGNDSSQQQVAQLQQQIQAQQAMILAQQEQMKKQNIMLVAVAVGALALIFIMK